MAYLDSVLNVQVSVNARAIRQRSFGVPMFLAYHSFWTDLYKEFGDLTELVTAGVPTDHPIYLWATALRSQEPAVSKFAIGRRTRAYTQRFDFVPEAPEEGKVYSLDVDGVTVSYTAEDGDTIDDVIGGLVGAANDADITDPDPGGQGVTPNRTAIHFIAQTAGELHSFTNVVGLSVKDSTPNPGSGGIAADFAAVLAVNNSWYGLSIDSQSKAEILAVSSSVEAARKIFVWSTPDTEVLDADVDNDVMSSAQTAGYARQVGVYHPASMQYFSAALLGRQLPKQPGSSNWAWQPAFSSVDYYALTESEYGSIDTKSGNHYTDFAGQGYGVFMFGKTPAGGFIDNVVFSDWMRVRMQERLYLLFVNAEKVGQTTVGVSMIENQIRAQIYDGVQAGGLDPDYDVVYDIPTIAEIPTADLASRKASGFRVRARLAGAFNTVDPMIFTLTI